MEHPRSAVFRILWVERLDMTYVCSYRAASHTQGMARIMHK